MRGPELHPTPRPRDVVLEQVRAAGLALRRPAIAVAALAVLATLLFVIEIVAEGAVVDFHPEHWILPGLLGFLLPIGIWKGQARVGSGLFWALPVERRRHALTRVLAGWVWLLGGVAVFVLWLLALVLLSGGNVLAEETLRFIPSSSIAPGAVDPGAVRTVRWTPHPLLWLVPFTAATATYLLSSALALGTTLRGIIQAVLPLALLTFVIGVVGQLSGSEWLIFAPSRVMRWVLYEPYGLAMLLTASTEFLALDVTLPTGETALIGRGAPDLGRWATATLVWTATGLGALWVAASRHRERRGG